MSRNVGFRRHVDRVGEGRRSARVLEDLGERLLEWQLARGVNSRGQDAAAAAGGDEMDVGFRRQRGVEQNGGVGLVDTSETNIVARTDCCGRSQIRTTKEQW